MDKSIYQFIKKREKREREKRERKKIKKKRNKERKKREKKDGWLNSDRGTGTPSLARPGWSQIKDGRTQVD